MSTPLSTDDVVIFKHFGGSSSSPQFIGVFIQDGKPLPVQFYGDGYALLIHQMEAWLFAEREKLAKRESHLAYLRSEEAIAARKAASAARKAAKAASE